LKDGFVVNTILKEADLFCPNSVRINFTIYHNNKLAIINRMGMLLFFGRRIVKSSATFCRRKLHLDFSIPRPCVDGYLNL
ncbi:hypothetical protein C6Y13_14090, partial [Lactiplantibacillus pentosus]